MYDELFVDSTTGDWEKHVLEKLKSLFETEDLHPCLLCFVHAMRYLRTFFPTNAWGYDPRDIHLLFSVSVVRCRDTFVAECEASKSWEDVYKHHPAYTTRWADEHVVVIRGTKAFYESLAKVVRPLGRLANQLGFGRSETIL